jgi:hypothetical protein
MSPTCTDTSVVVFFSQIAGQHARYRLQLTNKNQAARNNENKLNQAKKED